MNVIGRMRHRLRLVKRIVADPERKTLAHIGRDLRVLRRSRGLGPGHYFERFGHRRHVLRPEGFLSEQQQFALWRHFRGYETEPLLTDKLLFHRHFEGMPGVRLPRLHGYTQEKWFHGATHAPLPIGTSDEATALVEMLLRDAASAGANSLFVKPSTGFQGKGAFRIDSPADAGALQSVADQGTWLVQDTIEQHSEMADLLPGVVNSLRLTTLRTGDDHPIVASGWLKVGRAGHVTDVVRGMLISAVDLDTGRLAPYAWTKFDEGGLTYREHPDSGATLSRRRIPLFADMCEMVLIAAAAIEYPIVGWDVAVASDGPVILEGNARPNYRTDEIASGIGYLDHPVLGGFVRGTLAQLGHEQA